VTIESVNENVSVGTQARQDVVPSNGRHGSVCATEKTLQRRRYSEELAKVYSRPALAETFAAEK
jgi:hypothetical protein